MRVRTSLHHWFYFFGSAGLAVTGIGAVLAIATKMVNLLTIPMLASSLLGCLVLIAIGKGIALLDEIAQRLMDLRKAGDDNAVYLALPAEQRAEKDRSVADRLGEVAAQMEQQRARPPKWTGPHW